MNVLFRGRVQSIQFISKTRMFFSCSHDGTIKHWDADSFELITTLQVGVGLSPYIPLCEDKL